MNDEINALASLLDTLELAEGGTVTRTTLDVIAVVSARLKALGASAPEPVVKRPSLKPVPGSASGA